MCDLASRRKQARITLDLLADAYDDWVGGGEGEKSRSRNPFRAV